MGGEGGFGKGGFGDKGKGKGKKGKGKGKGKGKQEEKQWVPMTKLGRLVNDSKINNLEEIYLHSLPIKEPEIIDHFYPPGSLKDEVLKIHPVQKMTSAGQTNRFVCYVSWATPTATSVWVPSAQRRWQQLSVAASLLRS